MNGRFWLMVVTLAHFTISGFMIQFQVCIFARFSAPTISRKWEEKIDEKPSCYESYVHTVCGDASKKSPSDGATKCHFLKEELESWSSLGFHHSVHYSKEENEKNNGVSN